MVVVCEKVSKGILEEDPLTGEGPAEIKRHPFLFVFTSKGVKALPGWCAKVLFIMTHVKVEKIEKILFFDFWPKPLSV